MLGTGGGIGHLTSQFGLGTSNGQKFSALRVYAQAVKRRDRLAQPQRDAFDPALEWTRMGANGEAERVLATEGNRKPRLSGAFVEADEGTRTLDLLHGNAPGGFRVVPPCAA